MNKKELLDKVKSLEGLSTEEKAYLINLVNTKKKYGLVWEDKQEDVEEQLRTHLPVLKEVKERAIINDSETDIYPNHILIEGDNLHSLTSLTFTHEGKIDVIYIDPPYNTGNKDDFKYNDDYVDKEDAFRHSKWLSFISKRIEIAKKLLSDDGVFFCSIGDDEVAQLTLLCNELFLETNQLGLLTRVSKTADNQGNFFSSSKDYVLAYSKNAKLLNNFKDSVNEALYKKIEKSGTRKGEKYRDDVAFYQSSLGVRPNLRYYVKCPDDTYVIPPGTVFPDKKSDAAKVIPKSSIDKVWRWSDEKYLKDKELLVFKRTKSSPLLDEKGEKAKWNIYTKSYLKDRQKKGSVPRDFVDSFINRKGADLIKQYDISFKYSKPFELVEHLIKITDKPEDAIILDFFAGSGTTLQAVLSLNENDNGKRQCIIATNNEENICNEVTYPRAQRIINKYINQKGKEMPFYPKNNLRYYKTDFVERETSLTNKRKLTQLSTELLCIKENCYTEVTSQLESANWHKFFTNGSGNYVYVIYDDMYIEDGVNHLSSFIEKNPEAQIKVYAFANGPYPYTEEFEAIAENIELAALPDAIYKAYQNILPKQNKEFVPELEEESPVEFDQ